MVSERDLRRHPRLYSEAQRKLH